MMMIVLTDGWCLWIQRRAPVSQDSWFQMWIDLRKRRSRSSSTMDNSSNDGRMIAIITSATGL